MIQFVWRVALRSLESRVGVGRRDAVADGNRPTRGPG